MGFRSLVLCLVVFAHACCFAQDGAVQSGSVRAEALEGLKSLIGKEMSRHKVKGMAVALVDGGRIAWAEGFGMADEAKGLPMRPDTVMNLGSGAKLHTSLGAVALSGQGRLNLDAPVSAALPSLSLASFGPDAAAVTPRLLMTHHSGLPSNHLNGLYTRASDPAPLAPGQLADASMAYKPGTVFSFSNLGTTVLGLMVEKAAGQPFAQWMDANVFAALSMKDTSYKPRPEWKDRLAVSYGPSGVLPTPGSSQRPAVWLGTTALDQAAFLASVFVADPKRLPAGVTPESLRRMFDPANAGVPLDMDLRVGLGWNLNRPAFGPAGTVAWNFGRLAGFRSLIMAHPEAGLGVVVLSNSASSEEPRDSMIDRVADAAMRALMDSKGIAVKPARAPSPCKVISPEIVTGNYATILGVVTVSDKGGKLVIRLDGKNLELEPCAPGEYDVRFKVFGMTLYDVSKHQSGLRFSFNKDEGGTYLVLHQNGERELFGVKTSSFPMSPAWEARLGKWVIENQGDDLPMVRELTLRLDDGLILYETRLPTLMNYKLSIPLEQRGETAAKVAGVGGFSQAMGDTFRFASVDGAEKLLYGGYVFGKK